MVARVRFTSKKELKVIEVDNLKHIDQYNVLCRWQTFNAVIKSIENKTPASKHHNTANI